MAKLIVQHDEDPGIAIILQENDTEYLGQCTQCGLWLGHKRQEDAIEQSKIHVDQHESSL